MYNKKVLSDAMKNLASRKAPAKKKDTVVNNNKLLPFISSEGYKQGPPPAGTNYRIPSDTIYNPTPYNIRAVGSNGEEKFIAAGDTRNHKFNGAKYVDEYQAQYGMATEPDSSKVYNNAINVLNFYKNSGNYNISRREASGKDWWKDIITERDRLNNSSEVSKSKVKLIGREPDGTPIYKKTPTQKVWSKPGPDPNKIYARELANSVLNLSAPMSLYDRRIAPQYRVQADEKKGVLPDDVALIAMYDPLAIAPAVKLSDAEIIKRYKKFGASGIPKSRLIKLGLIKDPSPKQSPVSLSFVPPTITDLEFEPPIEPETQWTNPNPEMDVEQRPQEPKTYIPEFKRQYRHDPRNFSNLWGLKPRYGHWVDVPVEADGGDISIPDLNQYEDGGEYDLTDDQIAELEKGGYIVEELPKAQEGKNKHTPVRGSMKTHTSKSGTITNKFLDTEGNTVIQVKKPDGKYYEKVLSSYDYGAIDPKTFVPSTAKKDIIESAKDVASYYSDYMKSPRYNEMLYGNDQQGIFDPSLTQINKNRNYNLQSFLSDPQKKIQFSKDVNGDNRTAGYSSSITGDITILPRGLTTKGVLAHEMSHSIDKPTNFITTILDSRNIPRKDIEYISKHRTPSEAIWTKPGLKNINVKAMGKGFTQAEKDWTEYVTDPTETRARLNDIRYQSKKQGIYDPFTQRVTPAIYKKLQETNFGDLINPFKELKDEYSDEEILWMLNNISKNDNKSIENQYDNFENDRLSESEFGGLLKKGGIHKFLPKAQFGPVGYAAAPRPSGFIPPKTAAQVQKEELVKGTGPTREAAQKVTQAAKQRADYDKQAAKQRAEREAQLQNEKMESQVAASGYGPSEAAQPVDWLWTLPLGATRAPGMIAEGVTGLLGSKIPGLSATVGQGLGAGFAGHGVYSLPSTYRSWRDAYQSGTGDYRDAIEKTLWNAADFLGVGEANQGLKLLGQDIKQARTLKKGLDVADAAGDVKYISNINDLKRAALKDEFVDSRILREHLAKQSDFATDQEAIEFIKEAQKNYTKSDNIMYDYINSRDWGFPGSDYRAVAHIIKNDLHPPINSHMYHGTTSTRLKDIMSRGLDNSLGDELNPGVMTRLNKGETTATGDIDYARGFASTSAEKTKGSPVILRFPNVNNYNMGYIGEHASPSKLEYSLDDGVTWLTDYKKGGAYIDMPKKKNSKRYSRSLLATNQLFAQNPLLKKQKSKKRKIFDPNAKYYQDGGEAVEQYQKGGPKEQYYTYAGSKNKYKKVGNQWYISNEGTAFDFVPIKDPTGSRTKELNKHAKIDPYPWIPSKSFERKINTVLGDPMGASGRAGEYYAPEDEDDVDNIRHTYSGYRTAKGIADATGNIPYVSNPLGYIGSSILGAAHEVGTMFSDPRSWGTVLSEAAEDQANNIRGAGMVFNQQSPARTVKNIAQMSRQGLLPDGYASGTWGPDYIDPYDLRQQEKAFRQSTGKPTPVSLTEKFEKGGFQDDINKRRKLLRDWTYGASIGMLQKAQEGLETRGTEEQPKELPEIRAVDPNDEVTQLMKARRDELSYAKNDRQKKRVSQRYDKLIAQAKERREKRREDEDEGNVLTGPKTGKQVEQETLASGNLSPRAAQRIEKANRRRSQWETAEDKRITREDEERKRQASRQALKESIDTSIDSGIGTSTYVDTPKLGDPFGRLEGENIIDVDERVGKQNQEAFVKYLVDASNKKVYGQGAGAIEQVTTPAEQYIKSIGLGNLLNEHSAYAILQDLMYQDPEGTAKGLEEAKYKVWQKSEQAAYDKMDPFWQVMNNLGALAADPLYYGEQTIKGERSLVGQGQRSVAPEYYEDAKYYDKALGDKGDLNALLNLFNPMAYGAAAGEDALRGKYGDAAVNALQGVLAGASGAGIAKGTTAGFKALNKSRAIFNPITGKATGYTVNPGKLLNTSILAEGVARDMDYTSPESTFYMADKLISGDKTWNESAAGLADNMLNYIGMKSTVDDIVSGWKEGGREALRVPAAAILKRWDKPLFSLTVPSLSNTLKQPTFGKGVKSLSNFRIGTRTPAVWNPETARYQVIGPRKIGQTNIAASDIARGMTFSGSISAGIGAYNSVNNAIDVVGSDDATFGEKYKAIKDAGYKTTGALIQAMAVPRVFRPIYSSPYVNAYFATNYYDELLKGDLSKNPNPLRGVFSTSRLIAHKKGGETYEIDNNTRRVLAKLGYQVEDID